MRKVNVNFFTFDKIPKLSHTITTNVIKGGVDDDDDLFLLDLPTQIAKKTKKTELLLYPDDTIADLKEKIYIETGILPCEQHYGGVSYRVKIGDAPWKPELDVLRDEYIGGAPINRTIYNNRELLDIIPRDHMRLGALLPKIGYTLNLIPLSEVLTPENLDEHSIELLYWSMVVYYPYFNYESFKLYCTDRVAFAAQYPALIPDITDKIKMQNSALSEIYDVYKAPPKSFCKYYPGFISGAKPKSSIVAVSIRTCSVLLEKRNTIEIKNIFYKINTSDTIPIIKIVFRNHELYKVTGKSHQIYNKYKQLFHNNYNSVTLLVKIDNTHYCGIEYRSNGKIFAHLSFYNEDQASFPDVYKIINRDVNAVHESIAKLGRLVFNDYTRVVVFEIKSVTLQILIRRKITTSQFDKLVADMIAAEFAVPHPTIINAVYWQKGVGKGTDIVEHTDSWNKFGYLTDPEFMEMWNKWYPGPLITMTNRDIDVKFDIKNVGEFELYTIYRYITWKMWQFKGEKDTTQSFDLAKINKLKMLEAHDPNLFNMQIHGSRTVYSRICQKQYQPVPIDAAQTAKLDPDSYVKFWNYTTESETYYHCPNADYKHPYFMVGYHPLGYCLMCCKKNKALPNSTQARVRQKCIENHTVTGDQTKSVKTRYAINYGKKIEPGRLSMLPNLLEKFIVYNISTDDLLSYIATIRLFKKGNKIYNIDRLIKIVSRSKVRRIETAKLEMFLHVAVWVTKRHGPAEIKPIDVINNPNKNRKYRRHMQRINNAGDHPILLFYDKNREGFIILDGVHRLARAHINNKPYIEYKLVTGKQLERSLIGREDTDLLHIDPPNTGVVITKETFYAPKLSHRRKTNKTKTNKIKIKTKTNKINKVSKRGKSKTGASEKEPQYFIYGVPQTYQGVDVGVGYCLASTLNMSFKMFIKNTMAQVNSHTASLIRVFVENKPITSEVDWNELFSEIAIKYYNIVPVIIEDNTIYTAGVNVDVIESFNLIMPYNIRDVHKYPGKNFMVIIRKREKSGLNEAQLEYNHHPIFIIISYSFFKRGEIERRQFNIDDPIIKIINKLISTDEVEQVNYAKIKATVTKVNMIFVNSKNLSYAAEVEFGGKTVYIGFGEEYLDEKLPTAPYPTKITHYDFAALLKLLGKLYTNITYKVIKHYGIVHNNIVHYCNTGSKRGDLSLAYNPTKIFKSIDREIHASGRDPIIAQYAKLAASRNSYPEYKQTIFDKLDRERNTALRKKIKTASRAKLKQLLAEYPHDYLRVLQDLDKGELTDYSFDRMTLNKLVALSNKFNAGTTAARKQINKIIKSLRPASNQQCVDMLTTEFLDPIKVKLIQIFDYNFQKMYLTKQDSEKIYINLI